MKNASIPKGIAPVNLSLFDKVLLNIAPIYGRNRLQNKMAVTNLKAQGYITPGSEKPSMRGFVTSARHPDLDILPPLNSLRAGSRDMWMNTPIAVAALRRMQTNVVGFGLTMQSRVDYDALGITAEAAEEWQRVVEREWRAWSESKECDIRRSCDIYELQSLVFMSELMSGDCFVTLPYVERPNDVFNLKIQVFESDIISNPLGAQDNTTIAGGVEVDDNGAPIAYHVKTFQKGIFSPSYGSAYAKWIRVPAFGEKSGRRNMLHLFRVDRPGQRRGVPILAPVIEPLKQIARLSEAELTAAVIASFFTVFIKNIPKGELGSGFTPGLPGEDGTVVSPSDPASAKLYEMGPGAMINLQENEDVTIASSNRPNAAFEPFFKAIVMQIGAAIEIPYEQLMLSYNASYSASRGAVLEAWKLYKTYRARLVRNFCQPVYSAWLTEAVIKGRIKAPGFLEDPLLQYAWCKSSWTGPGQGMINPESEAKASAFLIENNLSTHEEQYAERTGGDWEAAARTLAREKKLKDELGLKDPVKPGGFPPGKGQNPKLPNPPDAEQDEEPNDE